jgi:hypothetical protein
MAERRSATAMLGLAPNDAVGLETFLPLKDGLQVGTEVTNERAARALRALADQIEFGIVSLFRISVSGEAVPDKVVQHVLQVEYAYTAPWE